MKPGTAQTRFGQIGFDRPIHWMWRPRYTRDRLGGRMWCWGRWTFWVSAWTEQ